MQDDDGGAAERKASENDKVFNRDDADNDETDEAPLGWVPKKIVSEWTHDDGIRCISVIIQLSGGETLADSNDAEVQVSSTVDELAVSEVWNPLLADVRNFYLTFLKHKNESDEKTPRGRVLLCVTGLMSWLKGDPRDLLTGCLFLFVLTPLLKGLGSLELLMDKGMLLLT
jgi:hypothetical protein